MKNCPECSAEYDDNVDFCAKDGKALVAKTEARARLCPECANSVAEGAAQCPYCKADLTLEESQEWPARDIDFEKAKVATTRRRGFSRGTKIILAAGLTLFAVGIFLTGKSLLTDPSDRGQFASLVEEKIKELQEKEEQIATLQDEVAQLRKNLDDQATHVTQLTARLEEREKELASARQRLSGAMREIDRLASAPPSGGSKIVSRTPEPAPPTNRRRPAEPGLYETLRPTSVHEEPTEGSRTVSTVAKGTKVTVVGSMGDWLEVRSKHGKPPGFIRWDDAMFIRRSN